MESCAALSNEVEREKKEYEEKHVSSWKGVEKVENVVVQGGRLMMDGFKVLTPDKVQIVGAIVRLTYLFEALVTTITMDFKTGLFVCHGHGCFRGFAKFCSTECRKWILKGNAMANVDERLVASIVKKDPGVNVSDIDQWFQKVRQMDSEHMPCKFAGFMDMEDAKEQVVCLRSLDCLQFWLRIRYE